MSFESAYQVTKKFEGGYANSPKDAGGETFRGVSRVSNPDWAGWPIIDSLKADLIQKHGSINFNSKSGWDRVDAITAGNQVLDRLVMEIYDRRYYYPVSRFNLPQLVTDKLFDIWVNIGPKTGAKIFQRAVNQFVDPKIVVDGAIGPKTLSAVSACLSTALVLAIAWEQEAHYVRNVIPKWPGARKAFLDRARWIPEPDNV
jgi:lysozyme family protein